MAKHRFMRESFRVKQYHRRKDETEPAWHAFIAYRSMKPEDRELDKLIEMRPNLNRKKVLEWFAKYDWEIRAAMFDKEAESQLRWMQLRKVEEMEKRQEELGKMGLSAALKEMRKLLTTIDLAAGDRVLSTKQIIELGAFSAKLERLALGEPSEIIEDKSQETMDLSELSVEDLRTLRNIHKKLKQKKS